jgi:hypothetical protein
MGSEMTEASAAVADEVETLAGYGLPLGDIATLVGIDAREIERRFVDRLCRGSSRARAKVAEAAYVQASSGRNFQATAFWLRNRAGWSDVGKGAADAPQEPPIATPVSADDLGDVACLATARRTRGSSLSRQNRSGSSSP